MINTVVEGESDTGAAEAVIRAAGRDVARMIVKRGKTQLDPLLPNYCAAAAHAQWVVFRDTDSKCPKKLHARLLAGIVAPPPSFLLRLAHPMTEGWLMADRPGFAKYFGIKPASIPRTPESLPNAKATVLQLCTTSRSRVIRKEMVASGFRTGPLYVPRINEFATIHWDVERAADNSESLRRAIHRIRELPKPKKQ